MNRFTIWIGDLVTGGQVSALMAEVKRLNDLLNQREAQIAVVLRAMQRITEHADEPPL